MKIEVIRHLKEGEMFPKGYGVAYINYDRDTAVMYPIPINVLVAYIRKFWFWIRGGAYKSGYDRGYKEGKRVGRKYAFEQYKEQVELKVKKELGEKIREAAKGTNIKL